jgi:hypothetical protein
VIAEVGKKVAATDLSELIADIQNTLKAGAWKVFVEAKEIFGEAVQRRFDQAAGRLGRPLQTDL